MTVGKELFPRKSWGSKDSTSQQFFQTQHTFKATTLWNLPAALASSWEISSLPNKSRETELQIPLTWTLRQQLGYCESLTAGNNPASLGETPISVQYPPSYTRVHSNQLIWKESQGYYCLLERETSGWKRFLSRKGLLQAVADNTAPHAQSSQQNRTPCSNLVFPTYRSKTLPWAWISGESENLKRDLRKFFCSKPMYLKPFRNHQFSWFGKGNKNAVC